MAGGRVLPREPEPQNVCWDNRRGTRHGEGRTTDRSEARGFNSQTVAHSKSVQPSRSHPQPTFVSVRTRRGETRPDQRVSRLINAAPEQLLWLSVSFYLRYSWRRSNVLPLGEGYVIVNKLSGWYIPCPPQTQAGVGVKRRRERDDRPEYRRLITAAAGQQLCLVGEFL